MTESQLRWLALAVREFASKAPDCRAVPGSQMCHDMECSSVSHQPACMQPWLH